MKLIRKWQPKTSGVTASFSPRQPVGGKFRLTANWRGRISREPRLNQRQQPEQVLDQLITIDSRSYLAHHLRGAGEQATPRRPSRDITGVCLSVNKTGRNWIEVAAGGKCCNLVKMLEEKVGPGGQREKSMTSAG